MKKLGFLLVVVLVVSALAVPVLAADKACCDFEKKTCVHNKDGKVCCDFEKNICLHGTACCDFEKKTCVHNK